MIIIRGGTAVWDKESTTTSLTAWGILNLHGGEDLWWRLMPAGQPLVWRIRVKWLQEISFVRFKLRAQVYFLSTVNRHSIREDRPLIRNLFPRKIDHFRSGEQPWHTTHATLSEMLLQPHKSKASFFTKSDYLPSKTKSWRRLYLSNLETSCKPKLSKLGWNLVASQRWTPPLMTEISIEKPLCMMPMKTTLTKISTSETQT